MTYTVTLTRDLLEKASRRMDHEAGCGIESNDDCTCGTAEIHRAFAASMASHPTPEGEEPEPLRLEGLERAKEDAERFWLALSDPSAAADALTADELAEYEEAQRSVLVARGFIPNPPDGPASPVLGDEERERLKEIAIALEVFSENNANDGDHHAAERQEDAAAFLRKLAQGEERPGIDVQALAREFDKPADIECDSPEGAF